ncbi:MAG: hypothetical protein Q8834_02840, partial [Candidatus Phytoplasma australasiaticum]|nr:hypothetical protein [Candidatus Phytoplasma australasiaticum]
AKNRVITEQSQTIEAREKTIEDKDRTIKKREQIIEAQKQNIECKTIHQHLVIPSCNIRQNPSSNLKIDLRFITQNMLKKSYFYKTPT